MSPLWRQAEGLMGICRVCVSISSERKFISIQSAASETQFDSADPHFTVRSGFSFIRAERPSETSHNHQLVTHRN